MQFKAQIIRLLLALFLAAIGVYVGIRAHVVPLFSDEVFTFFTYVQTGTFLPFKAYLNANNHVLNSALAYFSFLMLGDGAFWLRLPNVIGYLLFAIAIFGFGSHFKRKWSWVGLGLTLVLSHYILDFFSLSRGYGLSYGLLSMSLLCALNYAQEKRTNLAVLCLLLLSLAVWANLALMTTTLAAGGVLTLVWFYHNRQTPLGHKQVIAYFLASTMLFLVPHAVAVAYALELQNTDMLYVGEVGGFYSVVVQSLCDELHGGFAWYKGVLNAAIALFLALSVVAIFMRKYTHTHTHTHTGSLLILQSVLLGSVIGIVLMHHLLGVYYPVERAAAHLIILFFLAFFFLIDAFNHRFFSSIGLLLALLTSTVFFSKVNTSYTQHWFTEAVPQVVRKTLLQWKQQNQRPPTLAAHVLQKRVLSYQDYLAENRLPLQMEDLRNSKKADFILTDAWIYSYPAAYDTVFYQPNTKLALLQRKSTVAWTAVYSEKTAAINVDQQFLVLADFPLRNDSLPTALLSTVSVDLKLGNHPLKLWAVTKLSDEKGNVIAQVSTDLQPSLGRSSNEPKTLELTQLLDAVPEEAYTATVFLWDMDEVGFELLHAHVIVSTN